MASFFPWILLLLSSVAAAYKPPFPKTFNVLSYGAVPSSIHDNSKAFLEAWKDACESNGGGIVWIPKKTFFLNSVEFIGPCKGRVEFVIKGTLMASSDPSTMFGDHWIGFKYVDRLVVRGGGRLAAQGRSAWKYNDCQTNPHCRPLPVTMRLDFVTNSKITRIRSIDSKNGHFTLFACKNVDMSDIQINAPSWSPNTDGIRIGASSNITIENSNISTGDDCVSMIENTQNITIVNVHCGPGHGFSIGSLGGSEKEEHVSGIIIRNSTLRETQNGLRFKTWAPSSPGLASDITFDNIIMENVGNPIFIDQQYCPANNCDKQAQSSVQIKNVTFQKVRGTSSSKIAINMQCSKRVPCENVKLVNINLEYHGSDRPATSSCFNVRGKSYGVQIPSGCL